MRINDMLFNLIQGIKVWEENSFQAIPDQLNQGFQQFVFCCAASGIEPPLDIADLIERLHKPVEKWGIPQVDEYYPKKASILDPTMGLAYAADDFLELIVHPLEYEQNQMRNILIYCREHDLEKEYIDIRIFLSQRNHAVITMRDLYLFLGTIHDAKLNKKVQACYEPLNNLEQYRVCPHCHWTLTWIKGRWRCNRGSSCHLLSEFSMFNKFPETKDQLLRMTRGIQRYTLLPGISEKAIKERLESFGYSVRMYPKIDEYDLLVEKNDKLLSLDVKDFYDPFYFAEHICERYERTGLSNDVWFVIPRARLEIFPAYIQQVKIYVQEKIGHKLQLISEHELYRKVGVLLS